MSAWAGRFPMLTPSLAFHNDACWCTQTHTCAHKHTHAHSGTCLGAGGSSALARGQRSRRLQAIVLLRVIVCTSAFLNKMPLSFLWGPLFPVPWVVFSCRFLSTLWQAIGSSPESWGNLCLLYPVAEGENELPESWFWEIKNQDGMKKECK